MSIRRAHRVAISAVLLLVLNACTAVSATRQPAASTIPMVYRSSAGLTDGPGTGPFAYSVRGAHQQLVPLPLPPMTCAPGSIVRTVDTGGVKLVAFGFDDGPWPITTDAIMSEFERRGMRATFFLIGVHLNRYPSIGRSVADRGHEIGNHTITHSYTERTILSEIGPAASLIFSLTGASPRVFRSPGLASGPTLQNGLAAIGLCNIFAAVMTGDAASPRPSAATICSRFKASLRPGAIVLAHDGGGYHESTAAAVPCMLDYATARGYRVVTISELLGQSVVNHRI